MLSLLHSFTTGMARIQTSEIVLVAVGGKGEEDEEPSSAM